jgi:hypothetical protein
MMMSKAGVTANLALDRLCRMWSDHDRDAEPEPEPEPEKEPEQMQRDQNQMQSICTAQDRGGGRMRSDVLQARREVHETETRVTPG